MASEIRSEDDNQFTCSICIGTYKTPRYLPTCGHTFCEHCLLTYVRNIQQGSEGGRLTFQCPVCRKSNSLPGDEEVSLEWIQTFPLNTVIVKMMSESLPQSSEEMKERKICDPCKDEGETNVGFKYCLDCKEVLCKVCAKYHKSFKMSKGHKLVDVDDMAAELDDADFLCGIRKCETHPDRDIEIYCKSHDAVVCYKCSTFGHSGCHVMDISEHNTDVQMIQKDTETLLTKMKSAVEHLDLIQGLRMERENNFKENLKAIRERMKQVRDQVVELIDSVERHVTSVTKQLEIEREDTMDIDKMRVADMKKMVQQNIAHLHTVQQNGTDKDKFVSAHLMRKRLDESSKQVCEEDEKVKQVDAELIIADDVQRLIETTVEKLAQIKVTESGSFHKRFDSVSMPPEELGQYINDLRESLLVRIAEHTVKSRNPDYRGVSVTRDGRVLLSDYRRGGHLQLYNPVDKTKLKLRLGHGPFSAVQINDTHLAVSMPDNNTISVVTVGNDLRVLKTFNTKNKPRTIVALSTGDLAVGCSDPPAFSIIDVSGAEIVQKLYMDQDTIGRKFKPFEYLAVDERRQHVIQPCTRDKAVYCFDLEGKPVFRYTHPELTYPQAVALDRCGNIYVCGYKNDCIHKLSPAGDPIHVFKEGVPARPQAICSDVTGIVFWVTHWSSPHDQVVYLTLDPNTDT